MKVAFSFVLSFYFTCCLAQYTEYVSNISNLELIFGDIAISENGVVYVGDVVDTIGNRGYMLSNYNPGLGDFNCIKFYFDTLNVKQLSYSPILRYSNDLFIALGVVWNPSKILVLLFNSECEVLNTYEMKVDTVDVFDFLVFHELIKTNDNNYLGVGSIRMSSSSDSLGTQLFLVKFNSEFNIEWKLTYGDYRNQYGYDAIITDSIISVFGYDRLDGDTRFDSIWRPLLFLEVNQDGNILKEQINSNEIRGAPFQVLGSPDGGFVSCSSLQWDKYYLGEIPGNIFSRNSIFKLNKDFEYLWEQHYGERVISKKNSYVDCVESIEEDGIVLCGSIADTTESKLKYFGVISKISWDGDGVWSHEYLPRTSQVTVKPDVNFSKIIQYNDGYLLAGIVSLDTPRVEYPSTQQLWFIWVDEEGCFYDRCNTTYDNSLYNSISNENLRLDLIPNPTMGYLNIYLNNQYQNLSYCINIYDSIGNIFYKDCNLLAGVQHYLDTTEYPNGIYWIFVLDQFGRTSVTSFIKVSN